MNFKDKRTVLFFSIFVFLLVIFAVGNNVGVNDGRNNVIQQPFEVEKQIKVLK